MESRLEPKRELMKAARLVPALEKPTGPEMAQKSEVRTEQEMETSWVKTTELARVVLLEQKKDEVWEPL